MRARGARPQQRQPRANLLPGAVGNALAQRAERRQRFTGHDDALAGRDGILVLDDQPVGLHHEGRLRGAGGGGGASVRAGSSANNGCRNGSVKEARTVWDGKWHGVPVV
jgi:hypothetical protein